MNRNANFCTSFLLVYIFAISCTPSQEISIQLGNVKFGIAKSAIKDGRVNESIAPAAILLSITDINDRALETDKKIALYSFGDSYVSESLQLKTGDYKLTKFLVLDANNRIIYASPLIGSPLAQYVTEPLPLDFSITENGNTLVMPQVLAINETSTPESFGYVSFGFDVVSGDQKRLKEVHMNAENELYKYKIRYYYDGDRVIRVEWQHWLETTPVSYWAYSYNNENQLVKSEQYQEQKLIETRLYQYNESGQLIYIDGYKDEELTYAENGLLAEVKITPGNFSHHEKAVYEYDENADISKISIHGYNELNVEKWITTERYFYDNHPSVSGNRAASIYEGAISYVLPNLHYFSHVPLHHNPVRLEYSEYFDWYGDDLPDKKVFYSDFEYNELGLPVKEKIHNTSLHAYYPRDGFAKEFIYE